jgi:hypothetical protein
LAELDRSRYARHLLLPEIGEAGQTRLCATSVRIPESADRLAGEVARDYLMRAGLQVDPTQQETGDRQQATGNHRRGPALALADVPSTSAIGILAGRAELEHAAAALAGAFAAVEVIKAALDLPRSALPEGLSLGGEPSP